jgi:hypothetical protein
MKQTRNIHVLCQYTLPNEMSLISVNRQMEGGMEGARRFLKSIEKKPRTFKSDTSKL